MLAIGFILLFLAYTLGIIAIVLEVICYRKGIEYPETILFSLAFLLVIFSISITCILDVISDNPVIQPSYFMYFTMVGLGLATPLNVYAERQMTMPSWLRYTLFVISALLVLGLILQIVTYSQLPIHWFINIFLGVSIVYSMIMLRRSKPGIHVKHQEKIERGMAIAILTILPLFLVIEFYQKTDVPITISVFFIIMATSKIFDNLKRLSLLKPSNNIVLKEDSFGLTPREQEVADHLVKGHTYAKIASELFISMPTVKTHVSNIYRKVGVKNKMELFYKITS